MIAQRRATYAGYGTRELHVPGNNRSPIVLLHGFGDSADCWRPVLERLGATGRRTVAVDLPSFGEAGPLASGPRLPQWDRFVAEVIIRHGTEQPVVLVGNSLGGLLAVRAAETVRALPIQGILAICAVGTGWTRLARLATVGDLAVLSALAALPVPARIRRLSATLITRALIHGTLRGADPLHVRAFAEQLATRRGTRRLVGAAVSVVPEVSAAAAPGDIVCPAIVVQGRRDWVVPVSAARRLRDMIPDSRLVILPRSGHCPHVDDPARVVALAEELATSRHQSDRKVR